VGLEERVGVVIAGSGFAGIGMAIRLRREGIEDFVVLERAGDVGGTWRDNTYPGAACDVPSHLYSFSFAPNPDWEHNFSRQREIREYLRRCTREFGIMAHLRFGVEVLEARWDEELAEWEIETNRGVIRARVFVSAMGALSEPKIPGIPGLEGFPGRVFHSARWDHGYELRGRRVAVVGTGASAVQFVPEIQPEVERLYLFQRTPPWVIPRRDRRYRDFERRLFRLVPGYQRALRGLIYWGRELYVLGFVYDRRIMKGLELLARRHLERQVKDPVLRRKLTPDYTIGCKRILLSNDYYPALCRPNAEVICSGLSRVRGSEVVASDGTARGVDAIIFATGFHVTDMPAAGFIRGRGGTTLAGSWEGGMQAYRGTTVAGFPNFFLLLGPNTGLGHNSQVFMIEVQIEHAVDCIRHLRRSGAATVEVRPEAQRAYNERVQRAFRGTVWTEGGCRSWYLDEQGRNTTLWPGFTWRFWLRSRRMDPADYLLGERERLVRA